MRDACRRGFVQVAGAGGTGGAYRLEVFPGDPGDDLFSVRNLAVVRQVPYRNRLMDGRFPRHAKSTNPFSGSV